MQHRTNILDIVVLIICLIQLIGIFIYLLIVWGNIPDQIPGHFSGDGTVTRWDSKGTIIISPIISFVLFIGMSVIERFPQVWNTGVRVTEENKYRVYRACKNLLRSTKLATVMLFTVITLIQSLSQALPPWLIPLFTGIFIVVLVYHIIILVKAR